MISGAAANVLDFGAVGDGVTDDTVAIQAWLNYCADNDTVGVLPKGIYAVNELETQIPTGIRLAGEGTIRATGANRLKLARFTRTRGRVEIDGITFDGNNIAARVVEIQNVDSDTNGIGSVWIGPNTRFINAKNTAPDTHTSTGLLVRGGLSDFVFEGEVDGVDSTSTSGAVTEGVAVNWLPDEAGDYVRSSVFTGNTRIRNVKNSNTVIADADGGKAFAPTLAVANFTVLGGALFENCQGRAIKSQVRNNTITGLVIRRSSVALGGLGDGLGEIALQYSGGTVRDAKIFHDGAGVDSVISATLRDTPDNPKVTIADNELTVLTVPATSTGKMVSIDATSDTVRIQGINVTGNKVQGSVDYLVRVRIPDIADNLISIRDNWAATINTAVLGTYRVLGGTPRLDINMTGNSCEAAAPLAVELSNTVVGPLSWRSNNNMPSYNARLFAYANATLLNVTGDGTTTNLLFGTVRDDPTSGYNAANGFWSLPIGGDYKITVQLALLGLTASHTDCRLKLSHPTSQLNTIVDMNPAPLVTPGGRLVISGTTTVSTAATDGVRVQLIISGGTKVVDIEASAQSSFISVEPIF